VTARLQPTASQTVGPYFAIGLSRRPQNSLDAGGDGAVTLSGRVLDGEQAPVLDAMLEVWHPHGWGRCGTADNGSYSFSLTKPEAADGQAPHVTLLVFARGLLKPVMTRVYFPDEPAANASDPVLAGVGGAERETLIAVVDGAGLRFDVCLQGDGQTAFFAL